MLAITFSTSRCGNLKNLLNVRGYVFYLSSRVFTLANNALWEQYFTSVNVRIKLSLHALRILHCPRRVVSTDFGNCFNSTFELLSDDILLNFFI